MSHYLWQHNNWTEFHWDANALLAPLGECRLRQGMLLEKMRGLGFELETEAVADVLVEEAVQTSAIEGERLDEKAVRSSVARRLGLPSAGLPVSRDADGLVSVLLDATQKYDELLTAERLKGWQAALFPTGYSGMHRIVTGGWRGEEPMRVVSGPVGRETVHFEAPPVERVEAEMRDFLLWWVESRGKSEGILRAALAHLRFLTIHPFEDGNGRIARALTDMALAQDEREPRRFYSLSSQIMAEREAYYNILERTQKGDGDVTAWLVWFLGCMDRALKNSERLLGNVLAKGAFWRQHAGSPLSERQRKVINRLLDAGPGGFEGGLTTRKYASLADVSRATAFREIAQLQEWGMIRQNPAGGSSGRNVSYDIVWPETEGLR
ncbi:MAG TPA: Fic family protein [Geobacteraceae bacterium]